jgi:6-methylpretetramide 4-monooxygenase / 4-hydroxy-6-methylpretetramide 12a-monooxygenase
MRHGVPAAGHPGRMIAGAGSLPKVAIVGDSAGPAVLVIGAGPSGLFSAVELARHGIPSRVVERQPRPHRQARATALQPATLEILHQAGVLDQVLANSVHVRFARLYDRELSCVGETPFAGAGCRWEFQCSLPQWRTEQLLERRLAELGGTVQRGVSVVSLTETDDHVDVGLETDGQVERVEVPWVIGAGGAHSPTRHSMQEHLPGSTYPGTALVAEIAVRCALPRDGSALIVAPQGYVLLAPLPGGRWLTAVGDLDEAEIGALARGSAPDAVAAAIGRRVPADVLQVADVGWSSTFRMYRRMAPHLADKRRFLLGDAGHLSSPFGGEGLNSGLHDAANLAWKLALEQHGRARPALLASYGTERGAADRHVLQVSDQIHEMAHGAVAAAQAGAFPAPPDPDTVAAVVRARCMLDVSYAGSPLVGEHVQPGGPPLPTPGPGDRYPDRIQLTGTEHVLLTFGPVPEPDIERLRRRWAGVLTVTEGTGDPRRAGLAGKGAVLVRPDGYVGFRAAPADHAGLRALDAHLDSYLVPAPG